MIYRLDATTPVAVAGADLRYVGAMGLLTPLFDRLRSAGVSLSMDSALPPESLEFDRVLVKLSDGRTATEIAAVRGGPVLLLDLALDYASTGLIGAAASAGAESQLSALAVAFVPAGIAVLPLADVAGLVVLRAVCCLANEAADVISSSGSVRRISTRPCLRPPHTQRGRWDGAMRSGLHAYCKPSRILKRIMQTRATGVRRGSRVHTLREALSVAEPAALAIAERVGEGLLARDRASGVLGMQMLQIAPGSATLTMSVREDMLNAHQLCHGAFIAALSDSAFACNSYNELKVAAGFSIEFIAPVRLGDVLTARCLEVSKDRRTGVYDADVLNQNGQRVALFRDRSHTVKGKPAVASA